MHEQGVSALDKRLQALGGKRPPLPQGPGLRLEPVAVRTYDAKFDLTLVSGEGRGGTRVKAGLGLA